MYTQCPHCLTLFRIGSDELKAAAGKARCCQCNQIFNALESLRENPVLPDDPNQESAAATAVRSPDTAEATTADSLFTDTINLDSYQQIDFDTGMDLLAPKSDTQDPSFVIRDDGLETEPEYFASGSESQMSELLDSDSASYLGNMEDADRSPAQVVPLKPPMTSNEPPTTAEFDTHAGESSPALPGTAASAADSPLFHFTERQKDADRSPQDDPASEYPLDHIFEKQPRTLSSLAWGTGALLLLLLLGLQLSWLYRERLIDYEPGRQLLTQMCKVIDCVVPEHRDVSRIIVEHRDLRSHPSKDDTLLLQLRIVNQAEFDQPFPRLQLKLFDDRDKLIAQRIFEPLEYLPDPSLLEKLMQPAKPVYISMELADPGKDVTGFKFEFL